MKKGLSLVLAMLMLFSVTSAFAVDATYKTTQEFLAAMDSRDLSYTYVGMDNSDNEKVTTKFGLGETDKTAEYRLFFDEEQDEVAIRLWNVIKFDPSNRAKVIDAVNEANEAWKFVRFYIDDDTNSVDAAIDTILPTSGSGDITVQMLGLMISVVDAAYPSLSVYDNQ